MRKTKVKPEQVFTPKGKQVNDQMYIHREALERALTKALRKPKHIIIHGESGGGKTWLYKKVFQELGVHYEVLNSATINSTGSIAAAIKSLTSRLNPVNKSGYEEKKAAEAGIAVAKGSLEHTNKYNINSLEPYLELTSLVAKKAGGNKAFVIIENLEHIVKSRELVKELSSLLLYLDDEEYAKNEVRLLLVGTPCNLRDYFTEVDDSQTIINRVQEIPEVSVLTKPQVQLLARKGLFELLNITVINDDKSKFNEAYLLNAISWFSTNVPQYVHEICLELAIEAEAFNNKITNHLYEGSLRNWVQEALVSENARLEKHINSKETRHGRRNQVIYTIGHLLTNEFSNSEVEEDLRRHFPSSTSGKSLNISANLSALSKGSHPIIRKTPNGTRYRFLDPKIKIMARWMFVKNANESITVKKFDDSIRF